MNRPPAFRKRLVWSVTAVLAVALTVLIGGLWVGAYGWLNSVARLALTQEFQHVVVPIVTADGTLAVERYNWNEPHHLYRGRHIDPFYLQIFDASAHLVRESENIGAFGAQGYPRHILAGSTAQDGFFEPLRTFRVGDATLYYLVAPVLNAAGERIGTIQLAREDPGVVLLYKRMGIGMAGGLLLTLGLLWLLVWWVGGRVLRPLGAITEATEALSPTRLAERVPVPDDADLETTQLAGTLNDLLERLETAFEDTRRFTASAAHELRTPLTVIQGHVDVALRHERSPEDYRETLSVVRRNVGQLVSMVSGLLSLTRLDASRASLIPERVDVAIIAQKVSTSMRQRAEGKGLEMHVTGAETGIFTEGQADLLRHVFTNLLDNAIKFTTSGGIFLDLAVDGGWIVITVRDTGMGMTADVLDHATERFYRSTKVHAAGVEGSGLGLSVVDEIVRWHGGAFHLASDADAGTVAEVRLRKSDEEGT